jgi:hypothetical protein
MTDDDIDSIKRFVANMGEHLEPDGEWNPHLFLVDAQGEHTLVPIPQQLLDNDETSRIMLLVLATVIKKKKAVNCAFVSTSWRVAGSKKENETVHETAERLLNTTTPEEMVVIAICDTKDAQVFLAPVKRGGEHPELGEWQIVNGKTVFSGIIEAIIPALNSSREVN